MKMFVKVSIGVFVFFIFFLGLFYRFREAEISRAMRIAIFTPTTHPALLEIQAGFTKTLAKLGQEKYEFTVFNAQGNRTLLRAEADEIVTGNFNLILTIGAVCSQTVCTLLKKTGNKIPHIFAGVDGKSFAQEFKDQYGMTTGSYVALDYEYELEVLHELLPDIKKILLVYDPTHGTGLEKDKILIEKKCKKLGLEVHSVEVFQANEISQKVAGQMESVDLVLVLVDNTIVAGLDGLIVLSNRFGKPLFASDIASGQKGGAFAYGVDEYESGVSAAQLAYQVLVKRKKPSELELRAVEHFKLVINEKVVKALYPCIKINRMLIKKFKDKGEFLCF